MTVSCTLDGSRRLASTLLEKHEKSSESVGNFVTEVFLTLFALHPLRTVELQCSFDCYEQGPE